MKNAFRVGVVSALSLSPLCRNLAIHLDLITCPRPDRWSLRPTPLLGGLAIMAGATLGALAPGCSDSIPLLCGGWMAFALGLWDDRSAMGPERKIAGLCAAYSLERLATRTLARRNHLPASATPLMVPEDTETGPSRTSRVSGRVESALSLLICIVGTNAFNLVDNMDGLAAGLGALAAAAISDAGWIESVEYGLRPTVPGIRTSAKNRDLAAALCGACVGFLAWNASPAHLFMGDSGSLPLGYLICRMAVDPGAGARREQSGNPTFWPAARLPNWRKLGCLCARAGLLLAGPALDSGFALAQRIAAGRPLLPGNTDHLSHTFVGRGLTEPGSVLLLQAIEAAACVAALSLPVLWERPPAEESGETDELSPVRREGAVTKTGRPSRERGTPRPGLLVFTAAAIAGIAFGRYIARCL